MRKLLRFMELTGRICSSTLTPFSEIFLAINERELSPVPVPLVHGNNRINPVQMLPVVPGLFQP
jgi:hypothetical protein